MDASMRKKLEDAADEMARNLKEALLDVIREAYQNGRVAGFGNGYQEGKVAGFEDGKASAAALITGLRSLLGKVDGGELAPVKEARANEAAAPAEEPIEVLKEVEPAKDIIDVLREVVDDHEAAAGDDVVEVEQLIEPEAAPATPTSFRALTKAICDCALCGGFGTVEGELYDAPTLLPCICRAGMVVFSQSKPEDREALPAELLTSIDQAARERGKPAPESDPVDQVDEIPEVKEPAAVAADTCEKCADACPGGGCGHADEEDAKPTVCFRLNCVSHSKDKPNGCVVFQDVAACAHRLDADALVCADLGCDSFESGQPSNCSAIAEMRKEGVNKPATACPHFIPAPGLAGLGTFDPAKADAADLAGERASMDSGGGDFLCCSTCNIDDPDCASCNLLENEINERNETGRQRNIETLRQTLSARCVNRNCTAISPLPGKSPDVCLLLQGKDCANFSGVDEQGGASRLTFQETEGVGQGAAELSPEAAHLLELQKKCKHPKVFVKTVPGRGEVCQLCDLVTTPESLPLFKPGEIVAQADVVEEEIPLMREGDRREGDTFREETHQGRNDAAPPASCDHPLDLRQRNPDPKNGGFYVKCGGCGEIVNRLDAERRSIPRDKWPENQEAGKIVEIATGAVGRTWGIGKGGRSFHLWREADGSFTAACSDELTSPTFAATGGDYKQCPKCLKIEAEGGK